MVSFISLRLHENIGAPGARHTPGQSTNLRAPRPNKRCPAPGLRPCRTMSGCDALPSSGAARRTANFRLRPSCGWRIPQSRGDRRLIKSTTVLLPPVGGKVYKMHGCIGIHMGRHAMILAFQECMKARIVMYGFAVLGPSEASGHLYAPARSSELGRTLAAYFRLAPTVLATIMFFESYLTPGGSGTGCRRVSPVRKGSRRTESYS